MPNLALSSSVEDIKLSHVALKWLIAYWKAYGLPMGGRPPVIINRQDTCLFRPTIGLYIKSKVSITMFDYIKNMLNNLLLDMGGISASPAATHLFELKESCSKLNNTVTSCFNTTWPNCYFYASEHVLIYNQQLLTFSHR